MTTRRPESDLAPALRSGGLSALGAVSALVIVLFGALIGWLAWTHQGSQAPQGRVLFDLAMPPPAQPAERTAAAPAPAIGEPPAAEDAVAAEA
ncbi:MAG: hypothetical protein FJX56_13135, partial [Alphaproteobacteria bacterium]|nr:hypothetical protein [Alphaproteobacteria bacterium]